MYFATLVCYRLLTVCSVSIASGHFCLAVDAFNGKSSSPPDSHMSTWYAISMKNAVYTEASPIQSFRGISTHMYSVGFLQTQTTFHIHVRHTHSHNDMDTNAPETKCTWVWSGLGYETNFSQVCRKTTKGTN